MELTKEQTLQILYNKSKVDSIHNKYKYTTKYRWFCLSCLTTIYISYQQFGRNAIFCCDCYPKFAIKPTIVQYQYMRILKERQIKLLDSQIQDKTKPNKKP